MSKAQTASHKASSATHTHTHIVCPDSCHSNRPPVSLSALLDNIQAFPACHTTYATAFLLLRAAWHYLLSDPVAGTDSQPLLLVALRTWSLMSLRQLTDAVTAPRYNTTRWQTHCDKDIQAHQRVCRHTTHTVTQVPVPCRCARQQQLRVQPLFSIYFLLRVSSTRSGQPHICWQSQKILEFRCFSVT